MATPAKRMSESFHRAPHFWLTVSADVTNLKSARERLLAEVEAKTDIRLTLTDFLVKIFATAKFYMNKIVPQIFTRKQIIEGKDTSALDIGEEDM